MSKWWQNVFFFFLPSKCRSKMVAIIKLFFLYEKPFTHNTKAFFFFIINNAWKMWHRQQSYMFSDSQLTSANVIESKSVLFGQVYSSVILRWAAISRLHYKDLISCLYTNNLSILCLIKTLQHQMPSVATCCVLLPRELMLCDKPYFPNQ